MKEPILYILKMPSGRLNLIEAYSFDDLLMKLGDSAFFDRHGHFYEPDMKSNFVTSYKEITIAIRKELEKRRSESNE